jgi:hypothetical protein
VLGKWVIAAFLGFAAVFATDLRASQNTWAENEFQKMLQWPELTDPLRAHLGAIHDKLGVAVDLNQRQLQLKDDRAQIERAIADVDSARFAKAFEALATNCGQRAEKISFGAVMTWTGTMLVLDAFDRGLVAQVERVGRECASIEPHRISLAGALAPRNFVLQHEDIYQGKLNAAGASRWARAALNDGLAKTLDAYEASCSAKIERVELGSYTHYNSSEKIIELSAEDSPRTVIRRLSAAATACVRTLPKLAELDQRLAADRGLLLTLDPWNFYKGEITGAQVSRWLDSFSADPARLESLKSSILQKAPSDEYPQVRAGARRAIPVQLGNISGFPKSGIADGILAILSGGFVLLPVMAALDISIEGRTYFLDVTRTP